ncbi:MAG: hypothetical protein WDW38_010426 [Sanguina aurantia]
MTGLKRMTRSVSGFALATRDSFGRKAWSTSAVHVAPPFVGGGAASGGAGLERSMGVFDLFMFGVSAIMGAGSLLYNHLPAFGHRLQAIDAATAIAAQSLPLLTDQLAELQLMHAHPYGLRLPSVIVCFAFGMVVAIIASICYAEFASEITATGGVFVYTSSTFGQFVGWVVACFIFVEYTFNVAITAQGFSQYVAPLASVQYSDLVLQLPAGWNLDLMAVGMTCVFGIINLAGTQVGGGGWAWSGPTLSHKAQHARCTASPVLLRVVHYALVYRHAAWANNLTTAASMLCIFMAIGVGFRYLRPQNFSPFLTNGIGGLYKGTSAVFFSYIGFDMISYCAEETRNPGRDVPVAITTSLAFVGLLYILLATILSGMLPADLIDVNAPFSSAFATLGLPWMVYVMAVGALGSILDSVTCLIFAQARLLVSVSRAGLLPRWWGAINPATNTPTHAVLVTTLLCSAIAAFIPTADLAQLLNLGMLFGFHMVCQAVLFRRYYAPVHPRCPPLSRVLLLMVTNAGLGFAIGACSTFDASLVVQGGLLGGWLLVTLAIRFLLTPVFAPPKFATPAMPFIPCCGILFTAFLIGSLGPKAWERWAYTATAATVVYLMYGVHHSVGPAAAEDADEVEVEIGAVQLTCSGGSGNDGGFTCSPSLTRDALKPATSGQLKLCRALQPSASELQLSRLESATATEDDEAYWIARSRERTISDQTDSSAHWANQKSKERTTSGQTTCSGGSVFSGASTSASIHAAAAHQPRAGLLMSRSPSFVAHTTPCSPRASLPAFGGTKVTESGTSAQPATFSPLSVAPIVPSLATVERTAAEAGLTAAIAGAAAEAGSAAAGTAELQSTAASAAGTAAIGVPAATAEPTTCSVLSSNGVTADHQDTQGSTPAVISSSPSGNSGNAAGSSGNSSGSPHASGGMPGLNGRLLTRISPRDADRIIFPSAADMSRLLQLPPAAERGEE